jgi:hypothetical protein
MSPSAEFPSPVTKNGRNYFLRHQLENYKRGLAGLPLIPDCAVAVIELVPAPQAAEELGHSRRTLGRHMAGAKTTAAAEAAVGLPAGAKVRS